LLSSRHGRSLSPQEGSQYGAECIDRRTAHSFKTWRGLLADSAG
jgi:hypothetical protein